MKKFIALVLLQSCAALNALYTGKDNIKISDSIEGLREYQQKQDSVHKVNPGNPWSHHDWSRQEYPEGLFVKHEGLTTAPKLGVDPATWAPATSADDVLKKLIANRRALFDSYKELQNNPALVNGVYHALKAQYADKDRRYFENKIREFFSTDKSAPFISDDKSLFTRDTVSTLDELLSALAEMRSYVIKTYAKDQAKVDWQKLYSALTHDEKTKLWIDELIQDAQSNAA